MMPKIDLRKYDKKIAESRGRYAISAKFQEPDRVPIAISAAGSYYSRLFSFNIRDYYTNDEVKLEVQLRGIQWAFEELGDDRTGASIGYDLGPIGEAIAFDCPIEYPDDTSPRIVPILHDVKDIYNLKLIEPEENKRLGDYYKGGEKFKEYVKRMGVALGVGVGMGIHPPLSCACALMGPDKVYELMYTDPGAVRVLFDKCYYMFIRLTEHRDKHFNVKTSSLGLADDNSAFVSNKMYREQVFWYNNSLYERYGKNGRYLHADGPNDHHFEMYANDMNLTSMDMGGWSSIEAAKKYLGGKVRFSGGLNCKDFYYDFETAKPKIEHAIRIGAPGGGFTLAIGGETYPGVNPDTLIKGVAYAKKVGKYPIKI